MRRKKKGWIEEKERRGRGEGEVREGEGKKVCMLLLLPLPWIFRTVIHTFNFPTFTSATQLSSAITSLVIGLLAHYEHLEAT